jgi:hypothetical protein
MSVPADIVEGIAVWFSSHFPGSQPSARAEPVRDVIVFGARQQTGPLLAEFEVSDEALQDHSAETIATDLTQQRLIDRVRRDPTMRLRYTTDRRLSSIEVLTVHCDGRRYTVTRDDAHNVRVYDANGAILRRHPETLLVLPSSVFKRPIDSWQQEIRAWRDADQ